MIDGLTIVLDVGKTNAKLTLRDEQGRQLGTWTRANEVRSGPGFRALDVDGIEAWLFATLAACPDAGRVRRIVPVAHGAAAALLRNDALYLAPMDYEEPIPAAVRASYADGRDAFGATGSPLLPGALNLGLQLHRIEELHGPLPADAIIVPWPQYWAWRLSGVAASECTSLGCHSDLWRPAEVRFSDLATRRGWAGRFAPLRRADAVLGRVTPAVAAATGLPADCEVLCGLHDSNAALLAARGNGELAANDATVLSTGTWFVAMRSLPPDAAFDPGQLSESRDCLLNVDIEARPVPSSRFMGGREAEILLGDAAIDGGDPMRGGRDDSKIRRLGDLLTTNARIRPSFVAGSGPYPDAVGAVEPESSAASDRRLLTSLYLALMADTALDLIGSRERLLIEGRYADDVILRRALATLRPRQSVYTNTAGSDLGLGALRLTEPALRADGKLARVVPLDLDLSRYARDWRGHAGRAQQVA